MASGVRARLGTDIGVAVTDIAGPGGGTASKSVGLVYLALDVNGSVTVVRRVFPGDRAFVRTLTVKTALDLVRRALLP
jgi:nicotinamide-nucleotide amidase